MVQLWSTLSRLREKIAIEWELHVNKGSKLYMKSKEEIMAYVDGQLPESEILRIENAINQDINAKNYYENLVEASDLINISYTQLENHMLEGLNLLQVSNSQKITKKCS